MTAAPLVEPCFRCGTAINREHDPLYFLVPTVFAPGNRSRPTTCPAVDLCEECYYAYKRFLQNKSVYGADLDTVFDIPPRRKNE